MKTYTIGGVFDLGMYEYNHNVIFMPLKDAQLLFNINDEIDKIEIRLYDINKLNKVKQSIVDKLYNNSNKLLLIDWTENNETLVNALRLEKNVMFFILFWIILIAAFNIVSSMILLVNDKMKGIAILRTIGASRGTIMRIFILYGMFIGFIGTGIGTGLGILISFNVDKIKNFLENVINIKLFDPIVYFLTTLPSHVDIYQVCSIVSMSLIISFIATIYPSYKVANIAPAKILRYE
jgi:lipoprotein-releasing system permease protein